MNPKHLSRKTGLRECLSNSGAGAQRQEHYKGLLANQSCQITRSGFSEKRRGRGGKKKTLDTVAVKRLHVTWILIPLRHRKLQNCFYWPKTYMIQHLKQFNGVQRVEKIAG